MICSERKHLTASALRSVMVAGLALGAVLATVKVTYAQDSGTVSARDQVRIRTGLHPDYSRVVFDFTVAPDYRLERTGTELRIVFERGLSADFGTLDAASLRDIQSPRLIENDGRTIMAFTVAENARTRDFLSGQSVVLDVFSDPSRAPATVPPAVSSPPVSSSDTAETIPQSQEDEPQPPSSAGLVAADTGEVEPIVNPGEEPDEGPLPERGVDGAGRPDSERGGRTDIELVARREVIGDLILPVMPVSGEDGGRSLIRPVVEAFDQELTLTFPWRDTVAGAAFVRGGVAWLVFDRAYDLDAGDLGANEQAVTRWMREVDVLPHPDALVMRLVLRRQISVVLEKVGLDWVVRMKQSLAKPRFPLVPERRLDEAQRQQIFIPAADLGRKVAVEDPLVGDEVVIFPTNSQGRGLANRFSFAAAELPETAQGIAVVPFSDRVQVSRFPDGVAIQADGIPLFSASAGVSQIARRGVAAGAGRLVDFDAWRAGEAWRYRESKSLLQYELSVAQPGERNEARWRLARFFVAHGRDAEAMGLLEILLEEDPSRESRADFRIARGIASFGMGQLPAAYEDLTHRSLLSDQDAELWLAMVAESDGRYGDALDHYRRGRDVMGTYDAVTRADMQLAMVRAAIAEEDYVLASEELSLLAGLDLTPKQVTEAVFQRARLAEREGLTEQAAVQYADLAMSPQRGVAARARYAAVQRALSDGSMTPDSAIEELERLRYAWRGNAFEVQVIDILADLYFMQRQYASGLESLRQGVAYYPDAAREKRFTARMGQTFRDLYLEGEADSLSPLQAIGLFYQFRELTPLGADGDLMIRRLADRLVSVDLLDRAAELLDYQVRVRTEGAARALIASNLAKVYILDQHPDKAIEILRATREPQLPADISASRRWVESRALIELDRFEEAEVLLEQDDSGEAELLRSDIYWGAQDWQRLVRTNRRLLGDAWRNGSPLSDRQRLHLIRMAIAMTFLEDRQGLIDVRSLYGNAMRDGNFANAFDLLTNNQELSGREIGAIASQIASVEKLQSFMRDYRSDFTGR
ncbi:tetratricopeptide repeat protein [Eilatimonas milleporae]|uniref:Tetratricopeptide repeat protein n=1 Tax=Eilatimonas milleporae TaxID=911205 RepID=A0A3M0CPY4_9PROT|nr:hypothetical protein [Eilatimonas milleporae]RMB08939.1 hypothetical protein BXY39_1586 [Eilatimonas milleporae]